MPLGNGNYSFMSEYFKVTEPNIPSMAKVAVKPYDLATTHPFVQIARMLSGTACFEYESKLVQSRINWITLNKPANTPEKIANHVGEDATEKGLSQLIVSYRQSNVGFFKKLKNEIAQCLLYYKLGRHTECFMHLYRALEFISDAVPILYLDRVNDFNKSIDIINSIATNEIGELKALSRVCELISQNNDSFKDLTFSISLDDTYSEYSGKIKSQLKEVFPSYKEHWQEQQLDILYKHMPDFIISVRNRSFHYMRKQANLDFSNIGGANELFKLVNKTSISWLATIYFQLVESMYNRHVIIDESTT